MRAVLVGEHIDPMLDIEVIHQENITFSTEKVICLAQLVEIMRTAKDKGAEAVIFQNTPTIVVAALCHVLTESDKNWHEFSRGLRIGLIIARPGVQQISAKRTFLFSSSSSVISMVYALVRDMSGFINARVKTTFADGDLLALLVQITVESVSRGEFDHIEWLDKSPQKASTDSAVTISHFYQRGSGWEWYVRGRQDPAPTLYHTNHNGRGLWRMDALYENEEEIESVEKFNLPPDIDSAVRIVCSYFHAVFVFDQ